MENDMFCIVQPGTLEYSITVGPNPTYHKAMGAVVGRWNVEGDGQWEGLHFFHMKEAEKACMALNAAVYYGEEI